jgi:hypothetical protein
MQGERFTKKQNWNKAFFLLLPGLMLALSVGLVTPSQAALVTYQFSGTVGTVNQAIGFPPALQGVVVGDTFTGPLPFTGKL